MENKKDIEFKSGIKPDLINKEDIKMWDEIEDDLDCQLAEWWQDVYEDLHADKVDMLTNEGHEYEE